MAALWRQLHTLDALVRGGRAVEPAQWIRIDLEFHLATYQAANAPRLLRLVEGLLRNAQPYRRTCIDNFTDLDLQHNEHHLLLDAIERRDAQGAELLLYGHVRRTRLLLNSHPEIFAPD